MSRRSKRTFLCGENLHPQSAEGPALSNDDFQIPVDHRWRLATESMFVCHTQTSISMVKYKLDAFEGVEYCIL
jgi:hypothetical protein